MKKLLSVISAVGVLLFTGNLLAEEARVELKAKSFARAWEKLNLNKLSSMLDKSAKGELTGFTFADKLDDETFKNRSNLISLLQSLNSSEKAKFQSCFSAFSSSMKIREKSDKAVITVSDAKGDAKYIVCVIQTNKMYKITKLKIFVCCDDDDFKTVLKMVDKQFSNISLKDLEDALNDGSDD